ncbi:MAG TPA: sulfatase-like hydrolase/transferase [Candidatus Angelobacter sp.]
MLQRIGLVAARLLVAAFVILTAGYCLLAYIPFTYHQVHLGALLPWLSAFARFHPYFYWPAFMAAVVTLPSLRNSRTRVLSVLFVAVYAAIGAWLLFRPLLARLENDAQSLLWCVLALTPLLWLALIDWLAQASQLKWAAPQNDTRRLFKACMLSAIFAWLLSVIIDVTRYVILRNVGFTGRQWAMLLSWSLVCHLVVFMAIFLIANFTGAIAGIISQKPSLHVFFYAAMAVVFLAVALKVVVFAPLSFFGELATLTALAASLALVCFLLGMSARLYRQQEGPLESPLALLLMPARFLGSLSRVAQTIILLAGSALGAYLLARASTMDWEYLFQKLLVLAIWAGLFAFFHIAYPSRRKGSGDIMMIAAALIVCLYIGFIALRPRLAGAASDAVASLNEVEDEYGNYDVSFRLARGILSPPLAAAADDSLYPFLVSNTNIPRSVRTDPVEINLAGKLNATAGPKPNIFMVVIDSLRRDYLSPYNSSVSFTPGIDAFARESTVVQNAFTRYTGTGLSEPSIWTGALSLHKQYITPFYPMNSLQKLLEFEQYQQFITKDEILSIILGPTKLLTELDAGRPTMSCELCRSLNELQTRITESRTAGHPIFAYTQPQNIHISVINREGRSVPPGESYPGFDAPYASRIKAMDKCFGDFINFLKSSGLYDNSIVILTADHGDSLGEHGLWGHAYNVVPEVVRVPLIVHLPASMQSFSLNQHAKEDQETQAAPAFLTDITPSLYYLLGHRPIEQNNIFGRPLFTAIPDEARRYLRSSYLVASSYGPVYGLLENSGHSLYVADAVEYTDHLYQWKDDGSPGSGVITPEIRADRQQKIRDAVNEVNGFYGFK